MHVVLDARTATNHFPGIGRYVFNLARALVSLLASNEQLTLISNPTESSPWNLAVLAGEQVQIIDASISPFSLKQQWAIPLLLRHIEADLYHSPYYLMPYKPGIPTILTVYDFIPLLYPQYTSVQARLLFRWATALALRTATHTLVISEATRRDLSEYYRVEPSQITSILLAADPIFFPRSSMDVAALRQRLKLPEQYILYLGSNKPHKNLVRLVEAWAQIQPQSNALVIAGVWDARYPEAKTLAEKLGVSETIYFLGSLPDSDLPALYSGATLFVFPSEYEGFGLPVLEAMSCGTPVVCARTSSLPEVTEDAALLFDPTGVYAIAKELQRLSANTILQAEFRDQALQRASQFSWQHTAQSTLDVYRKIFALSTSRKLQ